MTDRIYSVYFDLRRGDTRYSRMGEVLRFTAALHCPQCVTKVERIACPVSIKDGRRQGRNGLATNTDKLRAWVAFIDSCDEGDRVALLDSDMFIRDDFSDVWDKSFDVAYTDKEHSRKLPFNGGAVFVRVNDRSKALLARWLEVNDWMYANPAEHRPYRMRYGGMNQASFGFLLENGYPDCAVLAVPAQRYNCCDTHCWSRWRESAIVHVKSQLRRTVFNRARHALSDWRTLALQWHNYEQAMKAANGNAATG
jgi:hypothetical protein